MALRIRDYTILKVVQATHHQGDVRYCTFRGIQCSCISLMSITWVLFRSLDLWDKFDLDSILGKEDHCLNLLENLRPTTRVLGRKLL